MALINEASFRKALTKLVRDLGGHVSNIESHLSAAGIPDMNFYLWGADIWLELKAASSKKPVKMRPTQRKWHSDRSRAGGMSLVAVLSIDTGHILVVPGAVAAGLDTRLASWEAVAREQNTVAHNLKQLLDIVYGYYRPNRRAEPGPDRDRTEENPGSPGAPLPASGEDVGGNHWLLSDS